MSSGSPPAGGPPPFDPDSIDPVRAAEHRLPEIMAPLTVAFVLAATAVALRLYTRIFLIKAPGRDDWVMLACIIFTFGGYVIFILMVVLGGMGYHFDTLPPVKTSMFSQLGFWMSIIATNGALPLLKISIALNLLRLSNNRWYKWILWATLIFVVLYSFMGCMTWFLRCIPLARHWDKSIPGTCYSVDMFITFGIVNTTFNIFTDVIFATIPIPIIWNLQMKRKVKLYLIGVLSLGYAAVALGLVKAIYQIAYAAQTDRTYHNWIQFWGFLQLNVGIIAACASSLKPLVSKALGLSDNNSYGYGTGGYGSGAQGHLRTIGGTGASALRSKHRDHYELQDLDDDLGDNRARRQHFEGATASGGRGHTDTSATFYKTEGERSGSEEMILGDHPNAQKGIMMTTEVIVK